MIFSWNRTVISETFLPWPHYCSTKLQLILESPSRYSLLGGVIVSHCYDNFPLIHHLQENLQVAAVCHQIIPLIYSFIPLQTSYLVCFFTFFKDSRFFLYSRICDNPSGIRIKQAAFTNLQNMYQSVPLVPLPLSLHPQWQCWHHDLHRWHHGLKHCKTRSEWWRRWRLHIISQSSRLHSELIKPL